MPPGKKFDTIFGQAGMRAVITYGSKNTDKTVGIGPVGFCRSGFIIDQNGVGYFVPYFPSYDHPVACNAPT